jgi:hypothetical protein
MTQSGLALNHFLKREVFGQVHFLSLDAVLLVCFFLQVGFYNPLFCDL